MRAHTHTQDDDTAEVLNVNCLTTPGPGSRKTKGMLGASPEWLLLADNQLPARPEIRQPLCPGLKCCGAQASSSPVEGSAPSGRTGNSRASYEGTGLISFLLSTEVCKCRCCEGV